MEQNKETMASAFERVGPLLTVKNPLPLPSALPVLGTDSSMSSSLATRTFLDLKWKTEWAVRPKQDRERVVTSTLREWAPHLGPEQKRSTRNLDRSCRMGWLCRRTNCSRHTWERGIRSWNKG